MDLQEVFYLMGIIYMSIMFVLMIAIVVVALVINHKIHVLQRNIEEKLHAVTTAIRMGETIFDKAKETFSHKK